MSTNATGHRTRLPAMPAALALVAAAALPVGAQHGPARGATREASPERAVQWELGAGAVGLLTHATPAFDGRAFTEGYLTQPIVMAHVAVPPLAGLRLAATLDLEGLTLERGELNAGIYGEGYVDRRHPHTLVHELMATVGGALDVGAGARWSLAAGKGFVPFGSDDPMSRPFVKFPVNHHHAQILERWVAAAGMRAGPAMLELSTFNGDEPVGPYEWPAAGRFGDSFAARLTVFATSWLELSASGAAVESPEHARGDGLDQRKLHLGARLERGAPGSDGWRYALAEWALTEDRSLGRLAHRYRSAIMEGGAGIGSWEVALRGELTDRPEEMRLADPFRSPRPHGDGSVLGVTRWGVLTAAVSHRLTPGGGLQVRPFAEVAYLTADPRVRPAAFEPAAFYGDDHMWSLSAGLRVSWGMRHTRMGRYGVARDEAHAGYRSGDRSDDRSSDRGSDDTGRHGVSGH